jgi:hypothetical protein
MLHSLEVSDESPEQPHFKRMDQRDSAALGEYMIVLEEGTDSGRDPEQSEHSPLLIILVALCSGSVRCESNLDGRLVGEAGFLQELSKKNRKGIPIGTKLQHLCGVHDELLSQNIEH